ncbi:hypothetical protein [Gephyromycinifex aptenodytis]|uniref:hypothetical protein n=1 Tax=Gephyromycinifex aptenodytis TaxID=2716227 RepID=UPI0014462C7F|nr:hypothetical protein [Gephyromycinifex aptenodytis]
MQSAPAASATPSRPAPQDCEQVALSYRTLLPPGWSISCQDALPPEWVAAVGGRDGVAMSRLSERKIVLVRGRPRLAAAAQHELAHAHASTWPPQLRVAFARAIGQSAWQTRSEFTAPSEIFAESSVACAGLPADPRYPLVPCDLIEATRSAAGTSQAQYTR